MTTPVEYEKRGKIGLLRRSMVDRYVRVARDFAGNLNQPRAELLVPGLEMRRGELLEKAAIVGAAFLLRPDEAFELHADLTHLRAEQRAARADEIAPGGRKLVDVDVWTENAQGQKTTPGKAAPAKVTLARTHADQAYARQGVRSAPSTGRAGAPAAVPVRPAGKAAASKVHPTGQVAKKAAGRSVEGAGGRTGSKPPVAGHSTGKPAGQARQAVQADAARENRETRSKAPRGARSTTPPPSRPLRRG